MGHIHAELMKQYAEDAAETDTPWKRWEVSLGGSPWVKLFDHPVWKSRYKYRRRPRTININGFEVPEPVRGPLDDGEEYFAARTEGKELFDQYQWINDNLDKRWLSRGLIHRTKEAAVLHAKALLSFTEAVSNEK